MNKKIIAIIYALLAASLYAISIPCSKLLLSEVEPTMLAAFLYLGAGVGIFILKFASKKNTQYDKVTKRDLPYIIGMVVLDILAPVLLMFGLLDSASTNASLLSNFEIVCTSLFAFIIFKEAISKRMWLAIVLITLSSFIFAFDDIETFQLSWGAILVLLATLCWGLENNCTKMLSSKNTYTIVFIKGIFSGLGSLIVAILMHERFPSLLFIAIAMLLGFSSYGLSIFLYIKSQGIIGAAKTSSYYSVAPFIGTFLSFLIFQNKLGWTYFVGLGIMIVGTILVVIDTVKGNDIS